MTKLQILAATAAFALALPGAAVSQAGDPVQQNGPEMQMPQGGMMSDAMQDQMHEMMRPMMQDMMREMMREMMQDMLRGEVTTAPEATTAAPSGEHDAHHGDDMVTPSGAAATEAYRAANLDMHAAMDIEFSDDADIDFARGMIGHHMGAIDMARIVLEHGQDPELRTLAEEIIEAQESEIAFLRSWLEERGQ